MMNIFRFFLYAVTVFMLIPEGQFQDFRTAYLEEVGEKIPNDSPTDGEVFFVGSSRITPEQTLILGVDFPDVQFSEDMPDFESVWQGEPQQ